ncbi:MAG: mandelate racemase/muconate lactonizing enzyme family protein [Planctomycetota bacterium]
MKITGVESIAVFNGMRNFLFIVVTTDDGVTGVGEAGLSGHELAVQGALEHLTPILIGEDPLRIEHLWQAMARGWFFPASGAVSAAMSAVDIALWDIKGKALGVPTFELLGGRTRDKVLCYGHLPDVIDLEKLIDGGKQRIEQGFKVVRSVPPVGDDVANLIESRTALREGLAQFERFRSEFGPEIGMIVDCHTRFDVPEAAMFCREIESMDPLFVEDPLRSEDMLAYRNLRRQARVPLAAGEQFGGKWSFRQLIEEELIDYCRLDVCLVGGLTPAKKIAGWCEVHGIQLAVHNPIGPVATAASTHLNLSCPNVGIQEQPGLPGEIMPDVFDLHIQWDSGYLLAPTVAGLGIDFDIEQARKYPYRPWIPPQLRRPDGAVANW